MDKAKMIRIGLMVLGGAIGALVTGGVLPVEPWAAIAAAVTAWQVPALGHTVKKDG